MDGSLWGLTLCLWPLSFDKTWFILNTMSQTSFREKGNWFIEKGAFSNVDKTNCLPVLEWLKHLVLMKYGQVQVGTTTQYPFLVYYTIGRIRVCNIMLVTKKTAIKKQVQSHCTIIYFSVLTESCRGQVATERWWFFNAVILLCCLRLMLYCVLSL